MEEAMNMGFGKELRELPREKLEKLIIMYSRNWHTVDGLWFRGVEEKYGIEVALELDINMWKAMSRTEAKRIKEILEIPEGGGVKAVLAVIGFMSWAPSSDYSLEQKGPDALLTCTYCPPQEARIRKGAGEFACRPTFEFGFQNVADVVDPRVRVECRFCPPGPHPENIWCQWEFRLEEGKGQTVGRV
jgi:hypothetical protein